jgi:hypothetical protein
MGRTTCTEPQYLYKGALYLYLFDTKQKYSVKKNHIALLNINSRLFPALLKLIFGVKRWVNPLNTELNPICHLLALLEAHHILHITRIRVNVVFPGMCHLVVLYVSEELPASIYIVP